MDLVRDLLDMRVVDRNGRDIGRVDSVILELRDGAAPRVTAIELGPAVLGYRISAFVGRCLAALEHVLGVDEGRPTRIPIAAVLEFDPHVKVDLAVGETPAAALEQKLRRLVSRIPGAS